MKPSLEMRLKTSLHLSHEMQEALHILSLPLSQLEIYLGIARGQEMEMATSPSFFEEIWDLFSSDNERKIGEILCSHFDKNGLFREDIDTFSMSYGLEKEEVTHCLQKIQQTFQNGIGTSSFQEAFLFQLAEGSIAYSLIRDHYEDFLHQRYEKIAKKLHLSKEAIQEIVREEILPLQIPSLPRNEPSAPPIFPDIFLHYEGKWEIEISTPDISPEHPLYLICERRAMILKRVAAHLLTHMPDYLLGESPYIPPLLLKDLAQILGVSESSATRAVADKYLSSPRGLLPLRSLFSLPLQGDISIQKAKAVLLELLQTESALSDAKLSQLMKEKGIPIERRTIAKYRSELGIPSKHLRNSCTKK